MELLTITYNNTKIKIFDRPFSDNEDNVPSNTVYSYAYSLHCGESKCGTLSRGCGSCPYDPYAIDDILSLINKQHPNFIKRYPELFI